MHLEKFFFPEGFRDIHAHADWQESCDLCSDVNTHSKLQSYCYIGFKVQALRKPATVVKIWVKHHHKDGIESKYNPSDWFYVRNEEVRFSSPLKLLGIVYSTNPKISPEKNLFVEPLKKHVKCRAFVPETYIYVLTKFITFY